MAGHPPPDCGIQGGASSSSKEGGLHAREAIIVSDSPIEAVAICHPKVDLIPDSLISGMEVPLLDLQATPEAYHLDFLPKWGCEALSRFVYWETVHSEAGTNESEVST